MLQTIKESDLPAEGSSNRLPVDAQGYLVVKVKDASASAPELGVTKARTYTPDGLGLVETRISNADGITYRQSSTLLSAYQPATWSIQNPWVSIPATGWVWGGDDITLGGQQITFTPTV